MRLKLTAHMVGPSLDLPEGSVAEFGQADALRLIERGLAVPAPLQRETTSRARGEHRSSQHGRRQ